MTARVLVVDDLLANVRLLEAKLTAEYFDVITAMNGVDALESVQRTRPDIVLLDVMMPGMDGIEVCRRIKSNPKTHHIPVVMVTALDQPEDRVRGLEAGADDFLTKPVNDMSLFCRVKSLARLKMLTDELRSRVEKSSNSTLNESAIELPGDTRGGNILVVDDKGSLLDRIAGSLKNNDHKLTGISEPQQVVFEASENEYELIIINLDLENFDGLRLCSQLRSLERTRQIPILIIVEPDDERMMRALEMGVNDYLTRPIDRQELSARVDTQIKRWRYAQRLRDNVQQSMELAVTDPLTGLYNRRYMETQIETLVDNAANRGKSLSILTLDVDFFKKVNDTHGHDAGDMVLKELSERIKENIRNVDLPCRVGGEEFIVVLPDTDINVAEKVAERLRRSVGSKLFDVPDLKTGLNITISIGLSAYEGSSDTMEAMFKRADQALYKAKDSGRNQVIKFAA